MFSCLSSENDPAASSIRIENTQASQAVTLTSSYRLWYLHCLFTWSGCPSVLNVSMISINIFYSQWTVNRKISSFSFIYTSTKRHVPTESCSEYRVENSVFHAVDPDILVSQLKILITVFKILLTRNELFKKIYSLFKSFQKTQMTNFQK